MKNLRKIYGRASKGISNRTTIKLTMTPNTKARIEDYVTFGKGKSGSAFIELSVELMLSMLGDGSDIESIAESLNNTVDSPIAFARNLRLLSNYLEA